MSHGKTEHLNPTSTVSTPANHEVPPAAGYDTHDIDLKRLLTLGILSVALLVIILIGLNEWFVMTREETTFRLALEPEDPVLREKRAVDAEILTTYKLLDAKSGAYRIPIDRAMELMADEAFLAQTGGGQSNLESSTKEKRSSK